VCRGRRRRNVTRATLAATSTTRTGEGKRALHLVKMEKPNEERR